MMDYISQHKLLVGALILVVIAAAWYEFTQSSSPAPVLSTTTTTTDGTPQDQTLVNTLLTLQAVSLNGSIFSNPAFLSLKDFTTQIVSEPVGRPNPFAPIPANLLISATSTGTTNPNLFAPAKH